mmetsp:Transcript_64091/g.177839  ORF Transcript_64091/g.177839 Transcript_64091/m.177839 type:complete len:215 (+) Transcript_64091:241-885(+)
MSVRVTGVPVIPAAVPETGVAALAAAPTAASGVAMASGAVAALATGTAAASAAPAPASRTAALAVAVSPNVAVAVLAGAFAVPAGVAGWPGGAMRFNSCTGSCCAAPGPVGSCGAAAGGGGGSAVCNPERSGGANGGALGDIGVSGIPCPTGVATTGGMPTLPTRLPAGVARLATRLSARLPAALLGVGFSDPRFFFFFMRLRFSWSKWQNLHS